MEEKNFAKEVDLLTLAGAGGVVRLEGAVAVSDGILDLRGDALANNAKFSGIRITRLEFDCK